MDREQFRLELAALEARLVVADVSIAAVCRRAGVSPSTWLRWKYGSTPHLLTWGRCRRAAEELTRSPL